jgi:hypothetical protein
MVRHHHRALLWAALMIGSIAPAAAQQFSTLYAFPGGANGNSPRSGLAMDAAGALYGATQYDGQCSTCGLIYKLSPPAPGQATWTYQVLHDFVLFSDGIHPISPLTNFNNTMYGTASAGGDPICACGTIFSITPDGTYTQLYVFDPFIPNQPTNQWPLGTTPIGGLLIDTDGTMYGTTNAGGTGQPGPLGTQGAGIIYKFSGGTFTKLHDFDGDQNGGPQGMMIFGQDGAIYGTQYGGGDPLCHCGVIFRMNKDGSGYQVLYNFLGVNQIGNSHDGANPEGRLALGPDGTIYGTTSFGGSPSGYGTAWSIKNVGGSWQYNQLYIFGSPGNLPHSGLILGNDGALYGTGSGGGDFQSGVIYRLVQSGATWTYQLLHSFIGRDPNGDNPYGDLLYANGKFYGMNLTGGDIVDCPGSPGGCGTVFQFTPSNTAHDFNGDGKSDIAWRDTSGNTALWLMNGGSVLSSGGLGAVPTTWSIVGQRDFNGDGKADLLWRDTSGNTAMWFLNGAQVSSSAGLGNISTSWTVVGTGDFNGDGKADLLWRDTSGNTVIWLMNGGTLSSAGGLGVVPTTWIVAGVGDFNGDGKADILWRDGSGNTAIWFMNGVQVSSVAGVGNIPVAWSVVGTGDFDGDGKTDLLWRDTSGNTVIWLMNGGQVSSAAGLGMVPITWSVAQIGDYNGDGKSDILWRDTGGNTAVWFMNGVQIASSAGLGTIVSSWKVQGTNAD